MLDKVTALLTSLANSYRYYQGKRFTEPIRIDHLPWQIQMKFYERFQIVLSEIMSDDRHGTYGDQLPEVCKEYMIKNEKGLYIKAWPKKMIEVLKRAAQGREDFSCASYPESVVQHYLALDKIKVEGKRTAVIGSASPWIECMLLAYRAREVVTIEYGYIPCDSDEIRIINRLNTDLPEKNSFDLICSFSSIEHNGLGRYGDPIDPLGDIEAMNEIHHMLNDDGIALIGIPVGEKNLLVANGHRIYSKKYLETKLFKKFEIVDEIPYPIGTEQTNYFPVKGDWQNQPIFILKK